MPDPTTQNAASRCYEVTVSIGGPRTEEEVEALMLAISDLSECKNVGGVVSSSGVPGGGARMTIDWNAIGDEALMAVARFTRLWRFTPGATRESVEAARQNARDKLDALPTEFVEEYPRLVAAWREDISV